MNLYDVVIDLFSYLVTFRLRIQAGVKMTLEEVRKDLLQVLREQEVKIRQNPGLASAYEQVRYALVVFADEVILNSRWEHARDWERELLERRLYDSELGGDRFFEICEALETEDRDVPAILHTCLAMGFRGRYEPDAEALRRLKREMLEKVSLALEAPGEVLFPQAYNATTRKIRKLPRVVNWRIIPILLVILIGISLILDRVIIWNHLTAPLREMRGLAVHLLKRGELPSPLSPPQVSSEKATRAKAAKAYSAGTLVKPSMAPGSVQRAPKPVSMAGVKMKIDLSARLRETSRAPEAESPQDEEAQKIRGPEIKKIETMPTSGYTIQVGAFSSRENAEDHVALLRSRGYEPYLSTETRSDGGTWYRVNVGHYRYGEGRKARQAAETFKRKESTGAFIIELGE